jgi:hypothetical protein
VTYSAITGGPVGLVGSDSSRPDKWPNEWPNGRSDAANNDLVPADGTTQARWDASAGRLARDLGWTPACGSSGSRPACPLVPAIQFVGYDGFPRHGSPRTCGGGCAAHIHVSWVSPC